MPRITDFEIDDDNREKFAAHGLTARQVGQILDGPHVVVRNRKQRRAVYLVLGSDYGGTCIAVPVERTHDPLVWRPVTAWRCKDREKALL